MSPLDKKAKARLEARQARHALLLARKRAKQKTQAAMDEKSETPENIPPVNTSEDVILQTGTPDLAIDRLTARYFSHSNWLWGSITYLVLLLIGSIMLAQLTLANEIIITRAMIAALIAVPLYPAWRIGSILARFMQRRALRQASIPKGGQTSVKARAEARQARIDAARKAGKI